MSACGSCGRPAALAGLCVEHFIEADLEAAPLAPPGVRCGWCSETAIVQTSCSAPACREHVYQAMEQVGLVMRHVRESWEKHMPIRPDTTDDAVHLALLRSPQSRIEDVKLP